MRGVGKFTLAWALALLLALSLAACGGEDDPPAASGTTAAGENAAQRAEAGDGTKAAKKPSGAAGAESGPTGGDSEGAAPSSGSGAAAFRSPGGDNSVQEYGREAPAAEREEAAVAVRGYLAARASEEWTRACAFLSAAIKRELRQLVARSQEDLDGCPDALDALTVSIPPSQRATLAAAEVGSFRVEDDEGFVLYHGAGGIDYFMPVAMEGDSWKVAAIAGAQIL